MNVLHIASQFAGILSASPHISWGFKHCVSQEIRGRDFQVMVLEPKVSVDSKDIRVYRAVRRKLTFKIKILLFFPCLVNGVIRYCSL